MPTFTIAAGAGFAGAKRAGVSAAAVALQRPVAVIFTHPARVVAKIARHVSKFGAELIVVEDGASFLRCELSLYVTNPTHSQGSNTIYDFANLFSRVFWQIHRTFHFEPNGENATTEVDKEAPAGAGGFGAGAS